MMSGRVTEEPPFDLTRRGERQASSVSPIYTRTSDGQIQGVGTGSVYAARSASADAYQKRRLSQVDRLLLMFDRTRLYGADGPVETEPEPEGLSGSGVWRLTSDPATDRPTAIIEAHTDSGKLIYAA